MYYVTGSNLFGQWFGHKKVIDEFQTLSGLEKESDKNDININSAKLVCINWSFNVYQSDKKFYVVGFYNGLADKCKVLTLPEDCLTYSDLKFSSNDYNLFIFNHNTNILWAMNLETEEYKRLNLNTESPIDNSSKRSKQEVGIKKCVVFNDNFIYLRNDGSVYIGSLPTYVDTSHCLKEVVDVRCGYEHYLLLTQAGVVYSWGNGRRLQLGHGEINNLESPTPIEALTGIKITKIAAGGWHSLALSESGDLYAWGWNDTGQLGIFEKDQESSKSFSVPTLLDLFINGRELEHNVKDIACGSRHSVILLEDNTVWTTGCNKYGQLGLKRDKYEKITCFKKSFQCDGATGLICGTWSTVVISE